MKVNTSLVRNLPVKESEGQEVLEPVVWERLLRRDRGCRRECGRKGEKSFRRWEVTSQSKEGLVEVLSQENSRTWGKTFHFSGPPCSPSVKGKEGWKI